MNQLVELLPPVLLRAFGFTLLHSLWQGTLVGLLTAVLLLLLHRHSAVLRYRVAGGALVTLLVLTGLTFAHYYAPSTSPSRLADATLLMAGNISSTARAEADSIRLTQLLSLSSTYVEQHLPLLVGAWLLGMTAMLLRFMGEIVYVQRLRQYRVAALPAAWQNWLDGLAKRSGLRQPVQLLASALVTSPVVVGWLRPIVLLPLGLATGLPTPELEMILAHELAHVLRRDYLFNILQSLTEIIFFYHPAVWFLAASLRTERENCCDDVAIQLHGDSRLLAEALAAVAELRYAAARPRLVLAAAGSAGSLLSRVRRLVQPTPVLPTFNEGFAAAVVVMAGLLVLTGSMALSLKAAPATAAQSSELPTTADARLQPASPAVPDSPELPDLPSPLPSGLAPLNAGSAKLSPLDPARLVPLDSIRQQALAAGTGQTPQAGADMTPRQQQARRKLSEADQKQKEHDRKVAEADQKMQEAEQLQRQAEVLAPAGGPPAGTHPPGGCLAPVRAGAKLGNHAGATPRGAAAGHRHLRRPGIHGQQPDGEWAAPARGRGGPLPGVAARTHRRQQPGHRPHTLRD